MSASHDGPCSPHFAPLLLKGNASLAALAEAREGGGHGMTEEMSAALGQAPHGSCVSWGIAFEIGAVVILADQPVAVEVAPTRARWLVFMHTSDLRPLQPGPGGFFSPMPGSGQLAEHAADYVMCYTDGSEERVAV